MGPSFWSSFVLISPTKWEWWMDIVLRSTQSKLVAGEEGEFWAQSSKIMAVSIAVFGATFEIRDYI